MMSGGMWGAVTVHARINGGLRNGLEGVVMWRRRGVVGGIGEWEKVRGEVQILLQDRRPLGRQSRLR